LLLVKSFYCKW